MTPDGNFERLSRDILQQAQSEAGQVISDAKIKADQIKKQAEEEAESEKSRIIEQAKRDSERIRSQAIATTQLKARTLLLESREILLKEVFVEVLKKLPSVQQWNDYDKTIEKLALEAISQMNSKNVVIRADEATSKLLSDSILKVLKSKYDGTIELGEILENKNGVIVSTSNGHLNYDNTLETRLNKLENELRSPVYHLLMGESL
jgi:V/A-type H+/Na+-transporting ATPase subunit E